MTNKTYERAFNIAIKYGFCSDCVQDLDKGHCHEYDCYQNAVKVIHDALEKLDAIEESKATVWHDAQNDPPKENGEYLCYYEYFRYGNYNCMYRTMDRGQFFNGYWSGEPTNGTNTKVLAWTELPIYNPPGGEPMTIILVIAAVCVYDLCGLLAVLYINHTDRMDTVDGADNVIVLIFWPLLVVTRIGIACYRIIKRLLK